ncbi:hypothetical protein [Sphingobium ummariense]|uniref:hypothetical protein n=1 Tax=Sphingobium ummariense TaxID=420994 RepID=UPI001376DED8|nr:hypothetical protein [Sphingobium ummariense]
MMAQLLLLIAYAIGDCPPDPNCEAREPWMPWLALTMPITGIATFFLIRGLIDKWR